jgi:hypothetical protein
MRQGRIGGLSKLRWAPPAQVNPTKYTLTTGFQEIKAGPEEDVLITSTGVTKTGKLLISGGRHVRVIGCKFAPTGGTTAIQFAVYRSMSFEGCEADMSALNGDFDDGGGFRGPEPARTYPDIYIQNVRCTGLHGSSKTTHADFYQAQNPIGNLYVDKVTGDTTYQFFFLRTFYGVTGGYFLSRVNITKLPNEENPITFPIWLDGNTESSFLGGPEPIVPTVLDQVYVTLPEGQTLAANGVWPSTGILYIDGTPIGALDDGQGNAVWPPATKVTGKVLKGAPPGGDFVAAGIGTNYVSPGWL